MLIVFPFQACLVHTSETIRVCYFLERLMERRWPVMLLGTAGTSKSVLVGAKLASLDGEQYQVSTCPSTTTPRRQCCKVRGMLGSQ